MAAEQQVNAGNLGAAEEPGPAAKRQRIENGTEAPIEVSYEPRELVDFHVKTSDGVRIGLHRAFVLRYCKLIGTLLESCQTTELVVSETAAEIQESLFDIIYDRSIAIKPATVLDVLSLADKYDAPLLVAACKDALLSPEFTLSTHYELGVATDCSVVDALALAAKHKFPELTKRCTAFIRAQMEAECRSTAQFVIEAGDELRALPQDDLFQVLEAVAVGAAAVQNSADEKMLVSHLTLQDAKRETNSGQIALARQEKNYKSLLKKYNKLLATTKPRAPGGAAIADPPAL